VRLGDSGSGVKQIQTALVAHGFKVGVDGQFGAQTAQAVKSFQQQNGLAQDGIVGPATWAKLQAAPSPSTTVKGSATTAKTTTTTAKTTTTAAH
jgi:peptidoglycan hydrolase-like protein with peptidoglycan-binding domain